MTFAMRLGIHSQAGYGFYVKLTPMSLLEQQLNPLSVLERQIMYSLATNQQLTTITNPHSAPLTVTNGDYGGKLMKNE
jgi:hypothetical protein